MGFDPTSDEPRHTELLKNCSGGAPATCRGTCALLRCSGNLAAASNLEMDHPSFRFRTDPRRRRAIDGVRLAGISRRHGLQKIFRAAQDEMRKATPFGAISVSRARPQHTRAHPGLAGGTTITVGAELRDTADDTEGKSCAAYCYGLQGDGTEACSPRSWRSPRASRRRS